MVNAGASIEAFLKLDASQFTGTMTAVSETVTKFKASMMEIGSDSATFNKGLRDVTSTLDRMIKKMTELDSVDSKSVKNFKTLASAIENIATASQRFNAVITRGGQGIQAINEVIKAFTTGMSSAEITIKASASALRTYNQEVSRSRTSLNGLSEGQKVLRSQFLLLENTLAQTSTRSDGFRAITQRLRNEYGLSGQKLAEVRSQLMQNTQATSQYAQALTQPMTKLDMLTAKLSRVTSTLGGVKTSLQSWKSLTDSIVNSTAQNLSTATSKINTTVGNLTSSLKNESTQLNNVSTSMNKLNGETTRATSNKRILNNETNRSAVATRQYANALQLPSQYMREGGAEAQRYRVLQKGVNLTLEDNINHLRRQSAEMQRNAQEKLKAMGYTRNLSASENQLKTSVDRNVSSLQRQASAHDRASASANRQATATKGLGRALSSLRMVGTMVASMMVYNFAHNLIKATRETVNAKSEMEGYFKMLGFGQQNVDKFNNALDQTIKRFQRVNKYSLGETISSIGVEFDLTTDEMIKAMDVTSMITSEYLRAGRNANEASLAVKDVLQGQFQRLSRETGVKGEQLKEAGWSGDNTDVEGLLNALRKVGEARHWDVFAEKANSLNDIVTILQNRFGEWSAEMVNVVQPSIVNAFNVIMSVSSSLGGVLKGLWEWLNNDTVGQVVGWTGLATAIGSVITALVAYRTGANLTQIVQMGLRGSIMATVFGLKAEEVANYGSRNSIVARMTSIKAETVAEIGSRKAILSKIIGLNAEKVAQFGVRGAILESLFAREYETAVRKGANTEELTAIALHYKEMHSKMSTTQAIWMHIFGLKAETVAEKGVIVALAERIASSPLYIGSLKAEEVAEMSTARAALFLTATLLPLVGIIAGIAIALYSLIAPLQQASEEMKAFGNLVENGDDIIKEHKKSVDSLTKSESSLKTKLSEATEGSKKYKRIQDELVTTQKDLKTANKNYENSIKAVEMARSRQSKFEEEKTKIGIHNQTLLTDAYIKAGISASEASELASHELNDAKKGAEQLRSALQMLKFESDKFAKTNKNTINMLDQYGISDEKIKEFGTNLSEAQYKISEGLEKFMTSDDLMERIGGWFEIQQGRLEQWWTEFNALFEVRDWEGMGEKLREGFLYIWKMFPWNDLLSQVGESIQTKGLIPTIMNALFGEGDSDGALDIAWQFLNDAIITPISSWLSWFFEDPVAHFDQVTTDLSTALAKFLFGKDTDKPMYDIVDEWVDDNIVKPLVDDIKSKLSLEGLGQFLYQLSPLDDIVHLLFGENGEQVIMDAVNGFLSFDWLPDLGSGEYSGMKQIDMMGLINYLFGLGENIDFSWATEFINNNILTPIQTAWSQFVADPMGFIGNAISIGGILNALFGSDTATNIWTWVNTNLITPIGNAIYQGMLQIPIVGDILQLLGLITNENIGADQKGRAIANWIGHGITVMIGQIPIVGDILRLLGLIPQTEGTARSNGNSVGTSISDGFKKGVGDLANWVVQEFIDIANGIKSQAENLYNSAKGVGEDIWNGVNSVLKRNSPGFIHDEVMAEFGTDIPNAIQSSGANAYSTAQSYAQNMYDGMNSVQNDGFGLGGVVDEYQTDAQMVATSSQMMGTQTTSAFNSMQTQVNASTTQMQGNVNNTYTSMQTKQATALNTMKTQNLTAYNDMYLKSNQSLLQMRDSTSNITHQMTNAWTHMKDQIVASANKLKSESTSHFSQLSSTIGSFYRKIQNPSNWGAGSPNYPNRARRPSVGRSAVRTIRGSSKRGAGLNPYTNPNKEVKLRDLMGMVSSSETVELEQFLALFDGGFGWNDWYPTHYSHIKSTSDNWNMKAPMILGKYQAGSGFRVGDFEGGKPTISFGDYVSTAEAIFGSIPYAFYYNSDKWGSWDNAIKHGEANCSDGADALIALAHTMNPNWSTDKVHTTLKGGVGHFYAVINGKVMDTTAFQNRGSWGHLGAGIPTRRYGSSGSGSMPQGGNKTVNVNVEISGTVYGVDDLDDKIQESVKKGLQEEFNDPYSIAI